MTETAPQIDPYDAFMQVPEHQTAEIINGKLVTQPRPAPKHALALS